MNLPFDYQRKARAAPQQAALGFELTWPDAGSLEASLAAAFAILLFRYNAQPEVALEACRVARSGQVRWRGTLRLRTPMNARCRDIVEEAAGFLSRAQAQPLPAPAQSPWEIGRAGIAFVESPLTAGPAASGEDLRLEATVGPNAVRASFLYDANLFRRATIERAANHLKALLARLPEGLDFPISWLPLLSPEERRLIASACDGRPRAGPPELAHKRIEARAAAAPAATAVRYRDQLLSYGSLNARANALARRLAAEGVEGEARVAVCLEPSLDVPMALLAVLKAGATYVPLDPTHPEARLRALMEDVRPRALITQSRLAGKLGAGRASVLALDDFEALTKGFLEEDLDLAVPPEQTASIFFTSGTTGAPKGAMASHANLASYVASAREGYRIAETDVMPAIARFSFSISLFELLSPLAAGGTLLILDREHILDLDRMSKTLRDVTIFHAGPSLLKNLVAHIKRGGGFEAYSRVRHASSGGDMVPPELLEDLKRIFSRAEVFVIYGCTEISCMGCTYPVPRDHAVQRTYVGRPMDGVTVRVLDPALNPAPPGVVGEIWFGGAGVVKGYLNRPDLTAQRFVDINGKRFYRTGDLGRLSEEGWLEMLGRADFQVKIRGIRVEPGEIEHCLRQAPGVRDAVVASKALGGEEKSLVAYVVLDQGRPPAAGLSPIGAIRAHLQRQLPEYMLPAAYVALEKLPLNHNMKVDRNALPAPEPARPRSGPAGARAPRSETEKRLAALWTSLLGLSDVGLDDRFLDIGGNSLLGLQLIVGVEKEFGVILKGLDIVRETLEGLAAICDARLGRGAAPGTQLARPAQSQQTPFETFYFGPDEQLYGVLTGRAGAQAGQAVLICPPFGQDHFRSHFVLRRLAARLSAEGIPSLRFDYYGCGDSLGESLEAGCERWRRDIEQAYGELKRRAGAARIVAVGVRLAAPLLGQAAQGLDLAALVLWDPVCDGARHYAQVAAVHESFVGRWRRLFRPPTKIERGAELLGLTCSQETVRELQELVFRPAGRAPLRWLATCAIEEQRTRFDALSPGREASRLEVLDCDPGWNDVSRLGDIMSDAGVSQALSRLAGERS